MLEKVTGGHVLVEVSRPVSANGKLGIPEGLLCNLLFSSDIGVAVPLPGRTEVNISGHCVDSAQDT